MLRAVNTRLVYSLLGVILYWLSSFAFAEGMIETAVEPNPSDRACLRCHKSANEKMLGAHATKISPNSLTTVSCRNCHGNTTPEHRLDGNDVMNFQKDMFSQSEFHYTAIDQNSVCMSCHEPDKLQTALWAHDVHYKQLACTNCHTLHQPQDPMKNISDSNRINLCVTCHTQQHELNAKAKEEE